MYTLYHKGCCFLVLQYILPMTLQTSSICCCTLGSCNIVMLLYHLIFKLTFFGLFCFLMFKRMNTKPRLTITTYRKPSGVSQNPNCRNLVLLQKQTGISLQTAVSFYLPPHQTLGAYSTPVYVMPRSALCVANERAG